MTWRALATWLLLPGCLARSEPVELSWPFVTEGWFRVYGSLAHVGSDAEAQDWARHAEYGPTRGDPILSPLTGTVVEAAWSCTSYGKTIVVANAGLRVRVAHLEQIFVRPAERVRQGETVLGAVGSSGPSPGCGPSVLGPPPSPHLHVAAGRVPRKGSRPCPLMPALIAWSDSNRLAR